MTSSSSVTPSSCLIEGTEASCKFSGFVRTPLAASCLPRNTPPLHKPNPDNQFITCDWLFLAPGTPSPLFGANTVLPIQDTTRVQHSPRRPTSARRSRCPPPSDTLTRTVSRRALCQERNEARASNRISLNLVTKRVAMTEWSRPPTTHSTSHA